jgi:pimeloyl-ACP methyl ester carboxylesterase
VAWIIATCLVAITIMMIVIQLVISRAVMRMLENAPPLNAGEFGADSRATELSFETEDGLTLQACHFKQADRPSRGLVLFCHELGGNRWSALSYCEGLFDAGFEIVSFDFRNHGSSDKQSSYEPLHWLTEFELADVRGALRFIESRENLKQQPMGIFGISRSGSAALAAASTSEVITCVACESAYSTRSMMSLFSQRWVSLLVPQWLSGWIPAWHVEISLTGGRLYSQFKRKCRYVHLERCLPSLRGRPVLLISGERDNYVRPEIAKSLHESLGEDVADLWMVPKARHNGARQTDQEGYDQRLVEFFSSLSAASIEEAMTDSVEVSESLR